MVQDSHGEIQQIVGSFLAGEATAMPRLVARFRTAVFGLCYRMLGQWQDAEDAVQETFLRVTKSLGRWDSSRDFEPWLLAIAANCCRNQLKQRQRSIERNELVAPDATPAPESQGLLVAEELDRALDRLPKDWAIAFQLFHLESLSYRQIAARLGRPEGTVKTWVHRARRQLAETFIRRDESLNRPRLPRTPDSWRTLG